MIIDTVDFVDEFDEFGFNIFLTNQGFAGLGETDTSAKITTANYPNFQTTIQLMSDSTKIQIPIDQKSGFLELSNLYDKDTIRINYLKQYSNCYKDTTSTRIEYYRVINDSVSNKPYKIKLKVKSHKNKCKRKPPNQKILTINGENYLVRIQKEMDEIEYGHGHGYKPRQTERTHENYKEKARIYFSSMTVRYLNIISVRIE